jgi:hypothetical protein
MQNPGPSGTIAIGLLSKVSYLSDSEGVVRTDAPTRTAPIRGQRLTFLANS